MVIFSGIRLHNFSFAFADDPRLTCDHDRVVVNNFAAQRGPDSDDAAIADACAFRDRDFFSDPHVVADRHRTRRWLHFFVNTFRITMLDALASFTPVGRVRVRVVDANAVGDHVVRTDVNLLFATDLAVVSDAGVAADRQRAAETHEYAGRHDVRAFSETERSVVDGHRARLRHGTVDDRAFADVDRRAIHH